MFCLKLIVFLNAVAEEHYTWSTLVRLLQLAITFYPDKQKHLISLSKNLPVPVKIE